MRSARFRLPIVKGYIRIGGAIGVGALIVLGAFFYVQKQKGNAEPEGALVTAAPPRTYIEAPDSDGDGIKDWEEDLGVRIFDSITSGTSSDTTDEAYVPPTTFTGKFAEAFFEDYMNGKITQGDLANKEEFVNRAVTAIEENTKSKVYTPLDIVTVPDSEQAIRDYGNSLVYVLAQHAIDRPDELSAVNEALSKNDPSSLEPLADSKNSYAGIILDAQKIPTPDSLVSKHLTLLSACEAVHTDLVAMQEIFTDPLFAIARLKRYESDVKALPKILDEIGNAIQTKGVVYKNGEAGSFFYLLNV